MIEGLYEPINVHVLNAIGNSIDNQLFVPQVNGVVKEVLNLSNQPKGIYFIRLEGTGIHHSEKVILY